MKSFIVTLFLFPILLGLSACSGVVDNSSLSPHPLAAESLTVSPVSPSNNTTPVISGTTTASTSVKLYSGVSCTGFVVGSGTSSSTGTFSLTSSALSEGSYNFSVLAIATGGSTCSTSSVVYVVDTTPPLFTIGSPLAALVNSASAAVDFSTSYVTTSTVNLTAAGISLDRTGTATCAVAVANGTSFTPTVSLSNCTGSGTVGFTILAGSATDTAGNQSLATASRTFAVDNAGLNSAVFSPATGIVSSVPAAVSVTFPEPINGTSVGAADFSVSGTCSSLPVLTLSGVVGSVANLNLAGATCAVGETSVVTVDLTGINDAVGNAGTGSVAVTYTIDNAGPTVATISPSGTRVTAIPASVTVTYNETVVAASVSAADFTVTGTCSVLPVVSVSGVAGAVATLSLTGAVCALDETVIFTADLTGVQDIYGNSGSGSFGETYTFDNQGPVASVINPVTADVTVIPASVDFIFSEDLLSSSVSAGDPVVSGTCDVLPSASLTSVSLATATYSLAGVSCSSGQTVTLTFNGTAVTDAAGNAGSGSLSATYTFDNVGPVATSTSPVSSSVNAVPASVSFTFDENILVASVAATDVGVVGTCTTLPVISLSGVAGATATFGVSGAVCASGQTVALTMNGNSVTDAAGNIGTSSQVASFTIDSVGPSPSTISPQSANLTTMPVSVSITFDESVLASSVANSDLGIAGTCSTLPSAFVSGVTGAVVTFSLAGAVCAESQTLILTMAGNSVTDLLGNAGANSQSVTLTKDSTGPSVTSFSPATGTVISIPNSVTVSFDEVLLAGSVAAADFSVSGTCGILPLHAVSGVAGQQAFISLSGSVCAHGQTTILTVNGAGISDTAGNAGAGTPAVSYTVDSSGPVVSAFTPNTGAPPASVIVSFSETLNPATVALSDFTLSGTCTSLSLSLDAVLNSDVTLGLTGAPCASGETLTITINAAAVTDSVGNAGTGTSFVTFTEP